MISWLRKLTQQPEVAQPFSGVKAIQAHLDYRSQLEDYVFGKSTEALKLPKNCCHGECMLGKWLHSEGGKHCKDIGLLDSLSMSCEEFHEAAAQAVLLADMGETEQAIAALQDGQKYADASEKFQEHLATLHISYMQPNNIFA